MDFKIIKFQSVDSTNIRAKEIISDDIEQLPCIIVADEQTEGRGRYGRQWVSQKGNLFCSIILPVEKQSDELGQMSFVTSLALKDSIASDNIGLKWPNDVVINDKKVAGILLETVNSKNKITHIIIGVGVNISNHPSDVMFNATSLSNENIQISRDELLNNFMGNFKKYYQIWLDDVFCDIADKWLSHCVHIDKKITVKTTNQSITGIFNGLSDSGELLLKCDSAIDRKIPIGDVFFD